MALPPSRRPGASPLDEVRALVEARVESEVRKTLGPWTAVADALRAHEQAVYAQVLRAARKCVGREPASEDADVAAARETLKAALLAVASAEADGPPSAGRRA